MSAEWCTQVVAEALDQHGAPEIFNTDQGSQFSSEVFTGQLQQAGIQISMDGKGRAIDNIFIERLWRSVKYEHVYLRVPQDGLELYEGYNSIFRFITMSVHINRSVIKHQPVVIAIQKQRKTAVIHISKWIVKEKKKRSKKEKKGNSSNVP